MGYRFDSSATGRLMFHQFGDLSDDDTSLWVSFYRNNGVCFWLWVELIDFANEERDIGWSVYKVVTTELVSRMKNRPGHWVCFVSMDGKTVWLNNTQRGTYPVFYCRIKRADKSMIKQIRPYRTMYRSVSKSFTTEFVSRMTNRLDVGWKIRFIKQKTAAWKMWLKCQRTRLLLVMSLGHTSRFLDKQMYIASRRRSRAGCLVFGSYVSRDKKVPLFGVI